MNTKGISKLALAILLFTASASAHGDCEGDYSLLTLKPAKLGGLGPFAGCDFVGITRGYGNVLGGKIHVTLSCAALSGDFDAEKEPAK